MISGLLALSGNVWVAWIHAGHHQEPSPVNLDGACETCDFPFGDVAHMCLGSGEQLAS